MGTWEIGNFGSDSAIDWVNDFLNTQTPTFIKDTVEAVFEDEFLESDVAYRALSAIEVIAASKGSPCSNFPEEISAAQLDKIGNEIDGGLISVCKQAVERIMDENDNELYELWREAGQLEEWLDVQGDFLTRLDQIRES